jgi:hypothetical protein
MISIPEGKKNTIRNKKAVCFLSSVMFSFFKARLTRPKRYKYPLKYNLSFQRDMEYH